jgi:hypothetical protein
VKAPSLGALRDELFEKVGTALREHGFAGRRRTQNFIKTTPGGRWSFHLAFIAHAADFDVTADVAVGIDALEQLVHENDEERARHSYSLGAELGNVADGRQKRWTVSGVDDLDSVSESIIAAFLQIGLPNLEKFSVPETALEALSGDDTTSWLHSPLHGERAKRALGLAFLLHDRNSFDELAARKTLFLTSRSDFGLPSFLDCRRRLEERFGQGRVA